MLVKDIHITCILLTFISFSIRGYWMMVDSSYLARKWVKILPHIVDTLLLLSGLTLAIMTYEAFYEQDWLMTKLLALVVYIILGSIALKRGKTKLIRSLAFLSAWCVFFYILAVARYKVILPDL